MGEGVRFDVGRLGGDPVRLQETERSERGLQRLSVASEFGSGLRRTGLLEDGTRLLVALLEALLEASAARGVVARGSAHHLGGALLSLSFAKVEWTTDRTVRHIKRTDMLSVQPKWKPLRVEIVRDGLVRARPTAREAEVSFFATPPVPLHAIVVNSHQLGGPRPSVRRHPSPARSSCPAPRKASGR